MKFYLCQTNDGLQLATTQADAKKLDPKFKTLILGDDKTTLAADINKLLKGVRNEPVTPPSEGSNFLSDDEIDAVNEKRPAFLGKLSGAEVERQRALQGNCPKCGTNPASRLSLEIMEIEKFLDTAPDHAVAIIAQAVQHRGEDLGGKPKRKRRV